MLFLCCESSLDMSAVFIFVLQIICERSGGDALFYCKLSLEEVVVLYSYLRIVFWDGGGDTMFVVQIFFGEVSSGYIRIVNYPGRRWL